MTNVNELSTLGQALAQTYRDRTELMHTGDEVAAGALIAAQTAQRDYDAFMVRFGTAMDQRRAVFTYLKASETITFPLILSEDDVIRISVDEDGVITKYNKTYDFSETLAPTYPLDEPEPEEGE